jgi:hypothetical protein
MLTSALAYLAAFIHTNLHAICLGITAVTLSLATPKLKGSIKRLVKNLHWLLRYAAYILVCTVGYTFLAQIIFRGIKQLLHGLSNPMIIIVTLAIYLLLAWIAKEQKAI